MSFRDELPYLSRRERLRKALIGIGLENDDVDKLVGKVKLDGLEELMLASFSMMKYIRDYLDLIGMAYEEKLKIPDLHVSLHLAILLYDKIDRPGSNYVTLAEESAKLEHISRAAYCWLKAHRMLKKKEETIDEIIDRYKEPSRFSLLEID